jgi:hypothetical protein
MHQSHYFVLIKARYHFIPYEKSWDTSDVSPPQLLQSIIVSTNIFFIKGYLVLRKKLLR